MAKNQGSQPGSSKGGNSAQNVNTGAETSGPSVSSPSQKVNFTNDKLAAGKARVSSNQTSQTVKQTDFIFGKLNYQVMLGGILVIALGFYLMSGTTDIMSSTKIVLAPIIVLIGFAIEFISIFIKPKKAV